MYNMKLEPIAWVITVEWCGEDTGGEWEVRYQFIEKDEEEAQDQLAHFTVPHFTRRVDHEYKSRKEPLYAGGQVQALVESAFEDAKDAAGVMGGCIPFDKTYWRASEEITEAIGRAEEMFMKEFNGAS